MIYAQKNPHAFHTKNVYKHVDNVDNYHETLKYKALLNVYKFFTLFYTLHVDKMHFYFKFRC